MEKGDYVVRKINKGYRRTDYMYVGIVVDVNRKIVKMLVHKDDFEVNKQLDVATLYGDDGFEVIKWE